ncbi:MAG: DNA polymerase IV [Candidatus Latescibacteria bacterium]|nr:DNA polymerase IV [Candidatus Latescibacterota bacterium]NIM22624.1 DNA polymerase IV [Candidatus Latescibacterota bacterium]NIM64913.1 DNA polymerase IV [Candidatus Latescibacterota bacterium]NIO01428.1 DNA polymerase IV [Candidatus Latescibacterota bacterium]NIO27938.1 DNA polymerase IV [Candidatus Latescibacterota bacterium]
MSERTILHVDMDAFFASVEVLDQPELRGKPVIVGGTPEERGVVAAASYEARKYGIHSAMSAYRAKKLCPHAIFIRPRRDRYVEISDRIFDIFYAYTPLVEPISIDEAFLDVTGSRGLFGEAAEIGRTIKRRIREEIGLVASIGLAPNKFLAKLASDLDKPDGFKIIEAGEAEALLAGLPVSRLWGVGKVTQKTLAGLGIIKVKDLLAYPKDKLESHLGSYTQTLLELARGIDDRPVVTETESKSIGAETTFAKDIADAETLCATLDRLIDRVAKSLRKENLLAHTVNIKARYPDFTTVTRAKTLPAATCSTRKIQQSARELFFERLGRKGRALRLIGVSVSNLVLRGEESDDLFPDTSKQQAEQVDRLLDELQTKYGSRVIRRGAVEPKRKKDDSE